ncbi:phosphoglycerate dehydrogenase [Clostridium sp. FP2]|uniref:phosphoglycerate dehydrogenase n=1 Tax=Clostridium TaxID=1485 RepID=UPI0013E94A96|nr:MULTISPECIES: phosphoglycerate dehydrogenase [Clostridium]MBW9156140.1 phosphoglycerate dehydrogenase [Clostridium tagluense]MBZ9625885.1 phosphoglycerate dehydrogenase [Clostridium sp. FP2]WLC65620.1 phosphoglycerate dehydrogenase [Clostridium tagluense]
MAIKTLFTYNYGGDKIEDIKAFGYDVKVIPEEGLIYNDDLEEIEVLVCYDPFKTLDIEKMKKLKWIQLSSIGIDQLPIEHVKNTSITITNNKGGYSIPMGEWIVLKTLELFKNSKGLYENQSKRKWKMDTSIMELYGKTIGFIGTGTIATEAAKRFQGFGVNIVGVNTNGRDSQYFNSCYPMSELNQMLKICDVVVVTLPYTKATHHLINEEKFMEMKSGAYFINVARGSIVDEGSLIKNLKNGKLAGAALDVYEEEPLKENNPLWDLSNVILTSHNSWVSEMRNTRRFDFIYKNMEKYAQGKELVNTVDLKKGY